MFSKTSPNVDGFYRTPANDVHLGTSDSGSKMTVLVVDDYVESLNVVRMVLETKAYTVLAASDPAEAMRICSGSDISILISDLILHLPLTGTDLALQVHESCPDTAILFVSGTAPEGWPDADFENLKRFLPVCTDFLQKPFTSKQLLAKVETLLNAHAPLPEFQAFVRHAERFRHSRRV